MVASAAPADLPLPGTDLADGEPGEIERSVLDEVGLSPAEFDLPGEFDSSGDRRAIAVSLDPDVDREDEALRFAFSLPEGSYATVVLREYLKVDPIEMG